MNRTYEVVGGGTHSVATPPLDTVTVLTSSKPYISFWFQRLKEIWDKKMFTKVTETDVAEKIGAEMAHLIDFQFGFVHHQVRPPATKDPHSDEPPPMAVDNLAKDRACECIKYPSQLTKIKRGRGENLRLPSLARLDKKALKKKPKDSSSEINPMLHAMDDGIVLVEEEMSRKVALGYFDYREFLITRVSTQKLERDSPQKEAFISEFTKRKVAKMEVKQMYQNRVIGDTLSSPLMGFEEIRHLQDVVFPHKNIYLKMGEEGQFNALKKPFMAKDCVKDAIFQVTWTQQDGRRGQETGTALFGRQLRAAGRE